MASHSKHIETFCPHCKEMQSYSTFEKISPLECGYCHQKVFSYCTDLLIEKDILNQCPACGCAHLFRQKDFNRTLGVLILILGIGFSYLTYGISLLLVTVLDLFLYFRVKEVAVCYGCSAVFRGFKGIPKLEPFQLVLHDHYRLAHPEQT